MPEPDFPKLDAVDPKVPKDAFQRSVQPGQQNTKKILKFPFNLDETDHWVVFNAAKPKLFKAEEFSKKEILTKIFLPMPANIGTTYDQRYNTEAIGIKGSLGAGASGILSSGSVSSIVNQMKTITKGDVADATNTLAFEFVEGASNIGGLGNAFKGAVAAQGISKNPYMAVMYDQPNIRSHQFQWKLIARNERDSLVLTDIVRAFKWYSSPGVNQKNPHFLDYPEQFDIDFRHDKHVHNIGPSVLTSLNVQYHAEGKPLYYNVTATEKAPVSINITAAFQEVTIVTKQTIDQFNR
tara:strand:+ start:274 stop:1158 length:885 start_codon:yes stop_codon:yes gene_type:complete